MPSGRVPPVLLLEHPRPHDPSRFQEVVNAPLSACLFSPYLVSMLRSKGIGVELLDANLLGLSMQKTLNELNKKFVGAYCNTPLLLGVHLVYLWDKTEEVLNLLSQIKSHNKQIHINLYGYYPTFAFREILQRFPFVDSVTLGEPEYPFMELAQTIIHLNPSSGSDRACSASSAAKQALPLQLQHIKGLAFGNVECEIRNTEFRTPHSAPRTSLDDLPFPDRSLLPLCQEKGLATYLLGSRGCYGRCSFCYVSPFNGSWRGRSPENIFEELCDLYNKGVRYFYFADANFFGPGRPGKERATRLADIILKEGLNIRFGMECRANDLEKDSLSRLVQAGLREVFLGIESACNHTLERFRKGTNQEVNRKAIELLRSLGIEPNLGFIMFEPQTTLEDVRTNLEFLRDNKLLRSPAVTAHLLSHKQTLFKGTLDYQKYMDRSCLRQTRLGGPEGLSIQKDDYEASHCERSEAIPLGKNEIASGLSPLAMTETGRNPISSQCRPRPNTSFAGYEAHYDFENPALQSFYEVIGPLCHNVLSILTPEEADSCRTAPDKKCTLQKINSVLTETYEKILSAFEARKYQPNGKGYKGAKALSDEALRSITLLYHEKRP